VVEGTIKESARSWFVIAPFLSIILVNALAGDRTELGGETVGGLIALKLKGGNCGPDCDGGDLVFCDEPGVGVLLRLLLRALATAGSAGGWTGDTGLDFR
jgi:hypothetical protein